MKRQFIIGAVIFFCLSCQAEYHAYDTRVDEECAVNHRMLPAIEQQCANRDEIRFAVLSDSQRWYDELNDAVDALNARDDVDFVIHCGDLTDWSLRYSCHRKSWWYPRGSRTRSGIRREPR